MTAPIKQNPDIMIFERDLVRQRRERSIKNFNNSSFLFDWSKDQLSDRLDDINRTFPIALQIGSRKGLLAGEHHKINSLFTLDLTKQPITQGINNYIQASEEFLPVRHSSINLIISNLNLHTVNDLPGVLTQIRTALNDDGLLLASMFGGETLHELRSIMMEVELDLFGGASPHIFPFADKKQMGDLLLRTGYALPVVDSDIITVTYDNIFNLFADLRAMGEGNSIAARNKIPLTREYFTRIAQLYANRYSGDDGKITASFEIIFLLGWAPHESQQQPLKPGSARHHLGEIL